MKYLTIVVKTVTTTTTNDLVYDYIFLEILDKGILLSTTITKV